MKTHTTEQQNIFSWFAGKLLSEFKNLVVTARAGVGKTYTIIQSFQYAPENKILYGVFNKKNQVEAQGKITDSRVTVSTWHSVGFKVIAKAWGRIKADSYAEWNRATQVCPELQEKKYLIAMVAKLVSAAKNLFIDVPSVEELTKLAMLKDCEPNDKDQKQGWTTAKIVDIAIKVMELSKIKAWQISFDDMVWLPVTLGIVKPEFDLVVGDEAQDLNLLQLTMLTQIVKPNGRICLVGDDKQAIYGFRGARSNGMEEFKTRLNATELKLSATFRCPKSIVELAKNYVPDYVAHESNAQGEVIHIDDEKMIESANIGDAILSRINAPLMRHCLAFIRKGKTAKIEGKDIAKGLIGIVESLQCADINKLGESLDNWQTAMIAKASGRDADRKIELIQDQAETLRVLAEVATNVQDVITRLNSMFQDSGSEYAKPAITLSTVHKAKGLEWPNVYLLADTFNRSRANATEEQTNEEKNVYYVAITRSQARLAFVNPKR